MTAQDLDAARAARANAPAPAPPPVFEIWEENWDTFLFFCSLRNQWAMHALVSTIHSPAGGAVTVTELRRACLPAHRVEASARLQAIPRARWSALFADILRMEQSVLDTDRERAERRAPD